MDKKLKDSGKTDPWFFKTYQHRDPDVDPFDMFDEEDLKKVDEISKELYKEERLQFKMKHDKTAKKSNEEPKTVTNPISDLEVTKS